MVLYVLFVEQNESRNLIKMMSKFKNLSYSHWAAHRYHFNE